MTKEWKTAIGIITVLIVSCILYYLFIPAIASFSSTNEIARGPVCPPLPKDFSGSDLVGTWVAEYFGGLATDKLIIRADGTYRQVYSSEPRNFESEWKNWSLENRSDGLVLLHLDGMRRCDDLESICNHLGGGLPDDEMAINQCNEGNEGYVSYSGEGILFVTGFQQDVPRGIVLRHPRLAGSEWTYTFRLEDK